MGLEVVEGVVTNPRDSVVFCLLCLVLFPTNCLERKGTGRGLN